MSKFETEICKRIIQILHDYMVERGDWCESYEEAYNRWDKSDKSNFKFEGVNDEIISESHVTFGDITWLDIK